MEGNFDDLRENPQMKWPKRHFSDYQEPELENLLSDASFKVITHSKNATSWGPTFLHYFAKST